VRHLERDRGGVTHVIEFTLALTFFMFIIQGFQQGIDYRLNPPLTDDSTQDAQLHNLVSHLIRSPGRLDNYGVNDTHWERYPPMATGADLLNNLTALGLAEEDRAGTLSGAKVLALRNLSYEGVRRLLQLDKGGGGIRQIQIRVTMAGAASPLIDWGADHWEGYSTSSVARVVALSNATGTFAARFETWLFMGPYRQTHVELSEVMYYAPNSLLSCEWIELYNPSEMAIDLDGWKLADLDDTDTLRGIGNKGTIISGHGYALAVTAIANISYLRETWSIPDTTLFLRVNDNGLGSDGLANNETIMLLDPSSNEIQRMFYQPTPGAEGKNETLERIDYGKPTNRASNWGVSQSGASGGSPGRNNTIGI